MREMRMPFKSKAQERKLGMMVVEGKMSPEAYAKWKKETPNAGKLPERIHPKKVKSVADVEKVAKAKYGKK